MILDTLEHLPRHAIPYADQILAFLKSRDPLTVPDGEHEIDGRNLFVRVMSYEPKPAQENKFETHRLHADVQYMARGIELMQVCPTDQLKPITEYDAKGDFHFFTSNGCITDLCVRQGEFTFFYPGEAHRPSCLYQNTRCSVKKLVFKIRIPAATK